jgi:exopolysaccharide biosynthesis polyprenyl glycosylphosphotransferase
MKRYSRNTRWRVKTAEQRYVLLVGDILVAGLALFIALEVWAAGDQWLKRFSLEFLRGRVPFWFYLIPLVWIFLMVELYDSHRARRIRDTLYGIGLAALISAGLYLVIFFLSPDPESLPRKGVAIFIVAITILTILWRLLYIRIFTAPQFMRRMLIVGAGKSGRVLVNVIKEIWPKPFFLVGLVDDDPQKIGLKIGEYTVIGGGNQLLKVIEEESISDLVLAISGEMNGALFQAILDAQDIGVDVTTMPVVYEELLGRVPILMLETDWIIRSFVDQARTSFLYEMVKRILDILGGLVGVAILIPFLPIIGLAIVIDTGFPIFYMQTRLGKGGNSFNILKFRTMVQDAEIGGSVRVTEVKDTRITRVGWFLRKTHLDEWPQFINVLRGEMSLVGPRSERSELVHSLQEKIPFYRARLLIKPGISGWAQVNFKYAATVEETAIKLEYDLYYIKHRNLVMDVVILLRTFGSVFGFKGQ